MAADVPGSRHAMRRPVAEMVNYDVINLFKRKL